MESPNLDQYVEVQREVATADDQGGAAVATAFYCDFWAEVKPIKGQERLDQGQLRTPSTYLFTLRYDELTATITTADRILWDGVEYNIRDIQNRGARVRFFQIVGESGVTQ